jgi:phage-related protein
MSDNDRLKWEGDSLEEIKSWPDEPRANIGADIRRLQYHEKPLDSRSMGKSLPGVSELRDEHMGVWYRLLYTLQSGWIYVLHGFKKKTNKTSESDIKLAKGRLKAVNARDDAPFVEKKEGEEKSA